MYCEVYGFEMQKFRSLMLDASERKLCKQRSLHENANIY